MAFLNSLFNSLPLAQQRVHCLNEQKNSSTSSGRLLAAMRSISPTVCFIRRTDPAYEQRATASCDASLANAASAVARALARGQCTDFFFFLR